jgi:hypothetical protein
VKSDSCVRPLTTSIVRKLKATCLSSATTSLLRLSPRWPLVFDHQKLPVSFDPARDHKAQHFSRDYKKQFGAPPQRDISRLRGAIES